ncbi:MAG: 3-dehydroquinate synthase [Treponemataceae bacterium]|nr:3-dehydroquinate synthase [Treponemataceae bacterium]
MTVHINLGPNSYDIVIERGVLDRAHQELNLDRNVLIVTDKKVPLEYAKKIASKCKDAHICVLPCGEKTKSMKYLEKLLKIMLENNFTRSDCLVAVGGGVIGDLTGFAAATYMRGLDFYNIPTTVLSQVDSSVGGKTAVNFNGVKNIVGSFYQPKKVLIDADVLKSLPKRQISNGLAEALKMALTFDEETFRIFQDEDPFEKVELLIQKSVQIKAMVVEKDEKESGLRRVLNFGHTLGHGIEVCSKGKLYHGECVAIGMLPMCSHEVRVKLVPCLRKLSLPLSCRVNIEKALNAVKHDKKAQSGLIKTVFVDKIGTFEIKDMQIEELKKKLRLIIRH